MKRSHLFALLVAGLVLLSCSTANAQKTINDLLKSGTRYTPNQNGCVESDCTFYVDGIITSQTPKDAQVFFEANRNKMLTVNFNSTGGEVRAAVELGRLIRRYSGTTRLLYGDCLSACVLAFVGGSDRYTLVTKPRFGIHTPYSIDTRQTTYEDSDKRFKAVRALVVQYLQDMNIPVGLFDEMLRYPAENMHLMSKDELSRFRVIGIDPSEQDRRDSSAARNYGIDKPTYLSNKLREKSECAKYEVDNPTEDSFVQRIRCRERIMRSR
jgi:ATP-dependent protease ClpP protease subunit